MIYLVHGQNEVDSRRFLIRLKSGYQDLQSFQYKILDKKLLETSIKKLSQPLFGGKSAILIEGFTGNIDILPQSLPERLDIILWSNKRLDVRNKDVKSFLFDRVRRANVFKLSDAVLLRREKEAQILLTQLLYGKELPEKIIGALARGFYLIYFIKEGTINKVNLSNFIIQKHNDQATHWTIARIKKGLLQLLYADLAIKDGKKPTVVFTNLISRLTTL